MGMRAAAYLRVSTVRQAEKDLSIPDQRRQVEAYCRAKGWTLAREFEERGASATDDKRPIFQQMVEAATRPDRDFDIIVVHSYSRFFRDAFQLEFYLRRLQKHACPRFEPSISNLLFGSMSGDGTSLTCQLST
jgi:DNA invertase Pin-like site-specific DNA recombinase